MSAGPRAFGLARRRALRLARPCGDTERGEDRAALAFLNRQPIRIRIRARARLEDALTAPARLLATHSAKRWRWVHPFPDFAIRSYHLRGLRAIRHGIREAAAVLHYRRLLAPV